VLSPNARVALPLLPIVTRTGPLLPSPTATVGRQLLSGVWKRRALTWLSGLSPPATRLRSAPRKGSRFAVVDLTVTPVQPPVRAEPTPSASLLRLHVLLIKDDPEIRAATQSLLVQWGCSVVAVHSVEALRTTKCEPVDAVLADFRLPGAMNGVQGVEWLRRRLRRDDPALIITGDTATPTLRVLQASGLPWLSKPLAPQRLRDRLAALG
jgi:CheY-like chemotaxis protein